MKYKDVVVGQEVVLNLDGKMGVVIAVLDEGLYYPVQVKLKHTTVHVAPEELHYPKNATVARGVDSDEWKFYVVSANKETIDIAIMAILNAQFVAWVTRGSDTEMVYKTVMYTYDEMTYDAIREAGIHLDVQK